MTELGVVSPHAVHDEGQFPGNSDDRTTTTFSAHQAQAPALDLRSGDRSHHHRIGCGVER
jgi:hypothetical protein